MRTVLLLQLPDENIIVQYEEPMVMSTIITPDDYISAIMSLIQVVYLFFFLGIGWGFFNVFSKDVPPALLMSLEWEL